MKRTATMGVLGSLVAACAAPTAVSPPPTVDAARLEQISKTFPGVADEVRLLEWQALEAARRGDLAAAERYARLARRMLDGLDAPPPRCPDPAPPVAATPPAPPVEAPPEVKPEAPSVSDRPRRRRRPRPERAVATVPPSIEELMQARAKALRALEERVVDADKRVWLDAGQRALIEAQRALAAGAEERARQHLQRVDEAIAAIEGVQPQSETSTAAQTSTSSALRTPLDALASDLSAVEVDPTRVEDWLVVALPESTPSGRISRSQRALLEPMGRLLRVYTGAYACLGGSESLGADGVRSYLVDVEEIDARRFIPCAGSLTRSGSPFFLALTFGRRQS